MADGTSAANDLNAQKFAAALASFKEIEPMWRQQLEIVARHPIELALDYASLHGRYERVQPYIHNAVSGAIEAIAHLAFDPVAGPKLANVRKVTISSADDDLASSAALSASELVIHGSLTCSPPDALRQIDARVRECLGVPAEIRTPAARPIAAVVAEIADTFERTAALADALEAKLRELGLWPRIERPEPLVIKSAFGYKEMPFEYWLAWVFLPRLREIVAQRGGFPNGSDVAAYAVRALSGCPGEGEILEILRALDDLVSAATGG